MGTFFICYNEGRSVFEQNFDVYIQMLEILSSRSIVSVSEIANLLGTKQRNILECKKDLEEAGYTIETIYGKYGGYKLLNPRMFDSSPLTEDEKRVLLSASEYLDSRND